LLIVKWKNPVIYFGNKMLDKEREERGYLLRSFPG